MFRRVSTIFGKLIQERNNGLGLKRIWWCHMTNEFQMFIHRPTCMQWFVSSGFLFLLAVLIFMAVSFIRQFILLTRKDMLSRSTSEGLSALVIASGWFALMIAIGMTWYGISTIWQISAELGDVEPSILYFSYNQAAITASIGLLIWAFGYFQEALFRWFWKRKEVKNHSRPNP